MPVEYALPFYVVVDVSLSMTDHIDALNHGLLDLLQAIAQDLVTADRARPCLIIFSESAKVLVPLSESRTITPPIRLTTEAETNFGTAFTLLRDTITHDLTHLRAQSHLIHRPAVFFMSDGQPTDPATWPLAYAALTDPSWPAHPNIITFGIGDADPATIARIATLRAFTSEERISPGTALHELAGMLMRHIVR